jgi:hypothetical protein
LRSKFPAPAHETKCGIENPSREAPHRGDERRIAAGLVQNYQY